MAMAASVAASVSGCKFDHLQIFADELKPLEHYKAIETRLNEWFPEAEMSLQASGRRDTAAARAIWEQMGPAADPAAFHAHQQDLVEQVIYAFGWRVTATHEGAETRSVVVGSPASSGVKLIITAPLVPTSGSSEAPEKKPRVSEGSYDHFAVKHLRRFMDAHKGAQGFGVLGFEVPCGELDTVLANYKAKHAKLLLTDQPHCYVENIPGKSSPVTVRVLDVYAYYQGEVGVSPEDQGTVIRFVERSADVKGEANFLPLPGLELQRACFDAHCFEAYCDHWVSNVTSRTGFLQTLEDTLGFTPKVDFNAGVVAAGEAQIESTVTGNTSALRTTDEKIALKDRGQVFLPINNALTSVGHVHWYLEELGQGIQHVASRVSSLPDFVQRANDMRKITGQGFTFLNIPRTYYGLLTPTLLMDGGVDGELGPKGAVDAATADAVISALKAANLCDDVGAVDVEAGDADFAAALAGVPGFDEHRDLVLSVIRRSIYLNLWKLLREQLDEATYLTVVRNKILIDVQGEDVLMQIFTCLVLQRQPGTEAPFLEFIQRVCSAVGPNKGAPVKPVRPGCGGFGIRNFLTLFLSIEVSKAMNDRREAEQAGDQAAVTFHGQRVELFTAQLVEANPILTEISDCMTGEGDAIAEGKQDLALEWTKRKEAANQKLQDCSSKYNGLMKDLREARAADGAAAAAQ
eukprot:CAMPEP_0118962078 /NCGR_PEP_ID=MMETSP1173-20130426/542_1 /TAXON_ID=1034831 /ORGANISM="Rhizochromulina marina cf, Strain CCMP1243" /LENGTH=689 /DNA_ID=CAMNT_0006910297 /DNA_START=23 /DNA_END=2092 /DNA_ORIENTATION=+